MVMRHRGAICLSSRPIVRNRRAPETLRADAASMCLAGMCALHCLAAPAAVGVLPLVSLTVENPVVEWGMLLLSLVTSAVVLGRGCIRQHRRWQALVPFVAGGGVLLWSRLVEEAHPAAAQMAVAAGAVVIIASHVLNVRWCRRAGAPHCGRVAPAPVPTPVSRSV
jgi:hypothetical protein